MNRRIVASVAILSVAAGVGWNVASHPASSSGLEDISLDASSEHTYAAAHTGAISRVRVRVSPSDLVLETPDEVPQISLAVD